MKKGKKKEEVAEDYCFVCKDGGLLIVCEHGGCCKAYHPECVGQDSTILETNERWICGWHGCFICHKVSKYQCFCCPISICKVCINSAAFVRFKKKKGFCNDCLKLALLIEENKDVDSDGDKVDFKDRDTYEFLFKEYWDIIKEEERLSLEDLHTVDALLKKGENNADVYYLDEAEFVSDVDDRGNGELPLIELFKGQHVQTKAMRKKYRSGRKEFTGWASRELIQFLTSIGKSTDKPIPQFEVYDMITEYIYENKLLHPKRKKKVICDARLHYLFKRRSINRLKISDLLESHFPNDQVPEDKSPFYSEDESSSMDCKRQRRTRSRSGGKTQKFVAIDSRHKVFEVPKKFYASVTAKNIKLVYLRRSLIEEFLKNPDTFDRKVIDCFVRVKCDPKDYSSRSFFQLMQVTGIKRASESYKIGENSSNIMLLVSDVKDVNKDIRICMLSDDDFSEEECQDLHKRMKEGLLKRPTIAEFDQKARSLHEEITNHWIDREILMLQKLIDRANEKGWRRELYEYIERREQLQTPSVRERLLKEFPQVIADAEIELEPTEYSSDDQGEQEGDGASPYQRVPERKNEDSDLKLLLSSGMIDATNEKDEGEVEGIGAAPLVSRHH
eukprot:TRINITY_DN847_c5_g1_i2.p1 TRINITY_DN847_c5_g1~~TRINITY_DN847_c5_g1_i2.p1  ORF type:complete len:616 (-),score=122.75 TRINITY_DN847_c5_g1_i2:831-2678(-)